MKKIIQFLTMVSLCLCSFSLRAQISPGIKGGLNFTSLSGFEGRDRVGLNAGFFLHKPINKKWCIQPELLYSGEGQRYFDDGEERTLTLDYIQAPFLVQYYPIQQFYLEAGPQFGVLLSAQDKGTAGDHINAKSDFTAAQAGLTVGAGVYIIPNVGIYGRYNFGLTDVSRFDDIVDHSNVGQVGMMIRLRRW